MSKTGPANVDNNQISVVETHNLTSDQIALVKSLRDKPTLAAKVLLGVDLEWYQSEAIEDVWRKRFSIFCWSRQIGKTFSEAVLFALLTVLYPNEDAVFIAPSLRQAMNPFNYVRDFYNTHAVFRSMVRGKITKTRIEFKNSSSIIPLPMGDGSKILGTHASIIGIDEYATFTKEFIDTVVMPMANRKKNPNSLGNRLSIIGTPLSKANHYYEEFVRYEKEQARNPNGDYHVSHYTFMDSDNQDLHILLNQAKAMPLERFCRENLAEFMSNEGGFFSEELLRACEDMLDIEFKGDPEHIYVLGIDPPSVNNLGGFVVFKLVNDNKEAEMVFCAGIPATYLPAPDLLSLTVRLIRSFNIQRVHVDQGGGGMQLAQMLLKPDMIVDNYECPIKIMLPPPVKEGVIEWRGARNPEDEISMLNNRLEQTIVSVVPFSPHAKSAMYFNLKNAMQQGAIKLPKTLRGDPRYVESYALQNEMEGLKSRLTASSYLSLSKADDAFDDRVDALVLAYDAVLALFRQNTGATKVGGMSHDQAYRQSLGGFNTSRNIEFPDRQRNDPWGGGRDW